MNGPAQPEIDIRYNRDVRVQGGVAQGDFAGLNSRYVSRARYGSIYLAVIT